MSISLLEHLAKFVDNLTFYDLPDCVVRKANDALFDLIGCYYGALNEPENKKILTYAMIHPCSEGALLWGSGMKVPIEEAALTEGFCGYSLEYDDGVSLGGHWGSASIPAICAIAENNGKSGKDVITAIVCAYEVGTRISRIYSSILLKNRIHFPSLMGYYAAAAGVGKLMGLSSETIAGGLGNSCLAPISPYSTAISGESIKNMYSGWPNFMGIKMMEYASMGLTGNVDIFESRDGLGVVFSGSPLSEEQREKALMGLGSDYMIMQSYFKPYPCCRWLHAPLHLLQKIIKAHPDKKILNVTVYGPKFLRLYDTKEDFSKKVKAQYSIPFTMAAMMINGTCSINEFKEPFRTSKLVLEIADHVRVLEDDTLEAQFPQHFQVRVVVNFENGFNVEDEGSLPWGPDAPPSKMELISKFRTLTCNVLEPQNVLAWERLYHSGIEKENNWQNALELLSYNVIK